MNRLIAISIVRNEKNRFLESWLENVQSYADLHIILDDASDDGTIEIIEQKKNEGYKIELFKRDISEFKTKEAFIRSQLWELTKNFTHKDDWILVVDADEFYGQEFLDKKQSLLQLENYDVITFRLLDMWNETHYRIDGHWSPYFNRLFRFKDEPFTFNYQDGLHHPSTPYYVLNTSKERIYQSEIPCFHKSYITEELRDTKYKFYKENVTNPFDLAHALTIKEVAEIKEYQYCQEYPEVMICSLVRDRDWILPKYLEHLTNLDYPKSKIKYYFIINNSSDNSQAILEQFQKENKEVYIDFHEFKDINHQEHSWNKYKLQHMAYMRNKCLQKARELNVEYLFSVDTDVLVDSRVLNHLIKTDKKIISPVFWASWDKNSKEKKFPQVWERGGYEISQHFLNLLRSKKGIFEVGGLGACTLIHKSVWNAGVNYHRVKTLPSEMNGEDRDFCTRASVHGFKLWASTYYDTVHIDDRGELK